MSKRIIACVIVFFVGCLLSWTAYILRLNKLYSNYSLEIAWGVYALLMTAYGVFLTPTKTNIKIILLDLILYFVVLLSTYIFLLTVTLSLNRYDNLQSVFPIIIRLGFIPSYCLGCTGYIVTSLIKRLK